MEADSGKRFRDAILASNAFRKTAVEIHVVDFDLRSTSLMTTKRFIAGAVCPSCGAQDAVQMYDKGDDKIRECVDCGFSDVMDKEPSLAGNPLATRVSQEEIKEAAVSKDSDVQIVRILDQLH